MERRCTECGEALPSGSDVKRKTCSDKCRGARSRRIKRARSEGPANRSNVYTEEESAVRDVVRGEAKDAAYELLTKELQPIVREAITDETIRAIGALVKLAPRVVEKMSMDLESEDAVVRQKAYTLIVKYTLGHPAIVTADTDPSQQQLNINFAMPRPNEAEVIDVEPAVVIDDDDFKQCDNCGKDKPITEFITNSDRCQDCFAAQQQKAKELLD